MKKQILFLFAASALFAACSSDDMPVNNNEGGDDNGQTVVEENLPSSMAVTTAEGLGMKIGAVNDLDAPTKAVNGTVYFTVEIPDDVLGNWADYVIKADDFAIRVDGEYKDIIMDESASTGKWNRLKISGSRLGVQVEDLASDLTVMTVDKHQPEMTFECYIWIENKKSVLAEDGEGTIDVERFTWEDKLAWINYNGEVTEETERGYDVTKLVDIENGAVLHQQGNGADEAAPEKDYVVRYSVYRGLQGQSIKQDGEPVKEGESDSGLGNTPYIKVSIHADRYPSEMGIDSEVIPVFPKED